MEQNKENNEKDNVIDEKIVEETVEETVEKTEDNAVSDDEEVTGENKEEDELSMAKKLKEENKNLKEEIANNKDRLLRLTAEYDNYRKRTAKEKEGLYADAYMDVIKELLPTIDNLERAINSEGNLEDLKKGIEMTMKGCKDAFAKLGIEEIDASGTFDPNFHNAVMHVEDEKLEKNVVAEVFQKGYKKGDKVIRHTMVKVAN